MRFARILISSNIDSEGVRGGRSGASPQNPGGKTKGPAYSCEEFEETGIMKSRILSTAPFGTHFSGERGDVRESVSIVARNDSQNSANILSISKKSGSNDSAVYPPSTSRKWVISSPIPTKQVSYCVTVANQQAFRAAQS